MQVEDYAVELLFHLKIVFITLIIDNYYCYNLW